jgi:hypothetical protein
MATTAPRNAKVGLLLYATVVAVLCALYCGADVAFAVKQTPERQFAGMLALTGWVFALVLAIVCLGSHWSSLRYRTVVPLLLCLGSCAGTPSLARAARAVQFEQRFTRFQSLIARMEAGAVPVSAEPQAISLPDEDRDLAYRVTAQRDSNGVLIVECLTGGGFPVVHSGLLYSSSGKVEPGSLFASRWPICVQVKPKWFRVAD